MLRINEIKLPLDADDGALMSAAAKSLRCPASRIKSVTLVKKAVDSRDKRDIFFVCNADAEVDDEDAVLAKASGRVMKLASNEIPAPVMRRTSPLRPVIVGFGPAGIFAALTLTRAGLRPLILERGHCVEERRRDVDTFWNRRILNTDSNVQFGEGGAGTFSDGKLTTGIKDPLCRTVFTEFCAHGAPEEILWSARPHIGTDKLGDVVANMRREIISLGGEIIFGAKLEDIIIANKAVHGVTYTDGEGAHDFETDTLLLCIGHSARDTVEMLHIKGIAMERKPFSVGARIEHPRELIDRAQYGSFAGHPALGAADYKLACHPPHGRGAYTFCMCPGGTVVAASSEEGELVVNGMSEWARDGENSNSAILVGIEPQDFPGEHVLAGVFMQREIERAAFLLGGGDYTAPAQTVGDFLAGNPSTKLGAVLPSCPAGVTPTDIRRVLPAKVTDTMADAIVKMNRMLVGFSMPEAVLTAPETRSSSPVRILRNEFYEAEDICGLIPCGEGAGYAGGIVSAAVDGMRCARAVIEDIFLR